RGQLAAPRGVGGAQPGVSPRVDLLAIDAGAEGVTVVMRNYGFLPAEFPGPALRVSRIAGGQIHFGALRIPIRPSLGTLATMPALLPPFGFARPHGAHPRPNQLPAR